MDVLSEVLKAVKLEGALFFNAEFSAPWCLGSPRAMQMAPYVCPGAEHLILYHLVTEGRAYARLADGRREELSAGDILVIPHGDAHILGNGPPQAPVDALRTFAPVLAPGLKPTRMGGGGELTRFVCGYMACRSSLSDVFLAGLPKLLKVRLGEDPSGEWLAKSIRFTVAEMNESNAGSGLVIARLSEVLFVETLRRYINALPAEQTGWLAGARDPVVAQALALIHEQPIEPWTVSSLARRTGVSRTRLAERFRYFLGESPMAYLAGWRLKLGAEILQSSGDTVLEIAAAVGYGSEAAFNRAFKREFGCPPAQFRRTHKALGSNRSRPSVAASSAG